MLPSASNTFIKQARVRPRKYYHVVTFSGLAEAVSRRGGEDAFASAITDALSDAVKRAGANFETTVLRGDGTGRLTNVDESGGATGSTITVDDARTFRNGQVIVFADNSTGAIEAGPVRVVSRNVGNRTITLQSTVTVSDNVGIYIAGEQSGSTAPVQVTALGLPALVNNTGSIYDLSRTTYPILQSKIINASNTALDESMLRRLRKQLMIETAVDNLEGFVMISNHDRAEKRS